MKIILMDTQSGNLHTVPNLIQFWKNVKYQNHRFGINHFTEDKRWIMANPKDSKLESTLKSQFRCHRSKPMISDHWQPQC